MTYFVLSPAFLSASSMSRVTSSRITGSVFFVEFDDDVFVVVVEVVEHPARIKVTIAIMINEFVSFIIMIVGDKISFVYKNLTKFNKNNVIF